MITLGMDKFPCFLCGEKRELRMSKKSKPYFICDPCGVQAFIRKDSGVERLNKVAVQVNKIPNEIEKSNKALRLIQEIEDLERKYRQLEDQDGFKEIFTPDKSREIQKAALSSEKRRLELALKRLTKKRR